MKKKLSAPVKSAGENVDNTHSNNCTKVIITLIIAVGMIFALMIYIGKSYIHKMLVEANFGFMHLTCFITGMGMPLLIKTSFSEIIKQIKDQN